MDDPRIDLLSFELQGCKDHHGLRDLDIRKALDDHELRLRGAATFADLVKLELKVSKMDDNVDEIQKFLATARGGYLAVLAVVGVVAPIIGQWIAKNVI